MRPSRASAGGYKRGRGREEESLWPGRGTLSSSSSLTRQTAVCGVPVHVPIWQCHAWLLARGRDRLPSSSSLLLRDVLAQLGLLSTRLPVFCSLCNRVSQHRIPVSKSTTPSGHHHPAHISRPPLAGLDRFISRLPGSRSHQRRQRSRACLNCVLNEPLVEYRSAKGGCTGSGNKRQHSMRQRLSAVTTRLHSRQPVGPQRVRHDNSIKASTWLYTYWVGAFYHFALNHSTARQGYGQPWTDTCN